MINILVVVFNKPFGESTTLTELLYISKSGILKQARLIIWDNSLVKVDATELDLLKEYLGDIVIVHTPENLPLSKIYNNVINNYIQPADYLILLDHDTLITKEYFTEIIDKVSANNSPDLLLPRVIVNGKIESPAYQYILFSKRWTRHLSGFYNSRYVTAINSGMVISGRFLASGFKYDERLLFYGTDTFMMYEYCKFNSKFYLLNVDLKHDLNLLSNPSVGQKAKIFKAIKKANLIVYSSNGLHFVLTLINNVVVAVKYAIKYRSLIFFK